MMNAQLKSKVRDVTGGVADKTSFKKDGTVEFRRSFFYRHGYDQDKLASSVKALMERAGIKVQVVEAEEKWQQWPRESYWRVVVRPVA